MNYELKNDNLVVTVNSHGAELWEIKDSNSRKQFLWDGQKEFWGRRSPVLFPIVGGLVNKQFSYNGKNYSMNQHGFARDMEFELENQTDSELWFVLNSSEETKALYPFDFALHIGYRLHGRTIKVMWKVENKENGMMYFSIGAHPAFVCPIIEGTKREDYFIEFEGAKTLAYRMLDGGLAGEKTYALETKDGIISFDKELFDHDALIFEQNQTQQVSILTPDKRPYITVQFDAPLFGVWTPDKKDAPFLCIEPWYGRCDKTTFTGTLEGREWGQKLNEGETFEASYDIIIGGTNL